MATVTPQVAATLIGVSRQAVVKQKARLLHSRQAVEEGGRLLISTEGLVRWWVGWTKTGPVWRRLVALVKVAGDHPEDALLAAGGIDAFEAGIELIAAACPRWVIEQTDAGLLMGPPGRGRPFAEAWRVFGEALKAPHPPGQLIDPQTGELCTAEGIGAGRFFDPLAA